MSEFVPVLRVDETARGGVRLCLERFFCVEAATLQEAADELVWKVLVTVMAFRARGVPGLSVPGRPDFELARFLVELDCVAAAGGDIRERLFAPHDIAG